MWTNQLITWVVLQCLIMSVFSGCDQIPDEAFNFVISFIMANTVDQKSPAQHLHVSLRQVPFKTPMIENILPATPPVQSTKTFHQNLRCITYKQPNLWLQYLLYGLFELQMKWQKISFRFFCNNTCLKTVIWLKVCCRATEGDPEGMSGQPKANEALTQK